MEELRVPWGQNVFVPRQRFFSLLTPLGLGSWLWFLPWGKVFCWSSSWLSCKRVSSVLCLCCSDIRGMGGGRGPHTV